MIIAAAYLKNQTRPSALGMLDSLCHIVLFVLIVYIVVVGLRKIQNLVES